MMHSQKKIKFHYQTPCLSPPPDSLIVKEV